MSGQSIYIHIPFCNYKCDYCNFFVLQTSHPNFQKNLISEYTQALYKQIDFWNTKLGKQEIKTIYFGGGTPLLIGREEIFKIIDYLIKLRWSEFLEEITIELNPDPFEETLAFIEEISKRYSQAPRIRFSFGLQTFDDEILEMSGRKYNYNQLKWYLRSLQKIKSAHVCYNFDFISFGTLSEEAKQGGRGWNESKLEFFEDFVRSQMADSFSIYMLELFPGSKRHSQTGLADEWNQNIPNNTNLERIQKSSPLFSGPGDKLKQCINPDDEKVMFEYTVLSDIVQSAGYHRYEVSNYALPWKQSIHNMTYRTMWSYLGLWASASGFLKNIDGGIFGLETKEWESNIIEAVRYTNITNIHKYIKGNTLDPKKTQIITPYEEAFEKFMLGMRSSGIEDCSKYADILIDKRKQKLDQYEEVGLCIVDGNKARLTNNGYNVANRIISELLK
jgi:oxygen-independent coproporphyrinogen-3 oxidase